jgi:NADH dehydrogenase
MKKQLLIIGGGFAGFWSAISVIRQSREIQKRGELEVTLINPDNYVTIRPGLNELSSEGLYFELDKYLRPLGVHQIVGRAKIINPETNEVVVSTEQGIRNLSYDYLILAAGGVLKIPNLPGIQHTFNVDKPDHAQRLEDHLIELAKKDFHEEGAATFLVVGSEFTGLETVVGIEQTARTIQAYYSARKPAFRIILLESEKQIATEFPADCRQYIQDVIQSKNIEVLFNSELSIIGPASVLLNNGNRIATQTVIWTKGMAASSLTQFFKTAKDGLNRLKIDQYLKLPGYDNVIAAGNVAHSPGIEGYSSLIACQFAQFEGRWAGHNAVNDLFHIPLKKYVQPDYLPCIDLGEPPAVSDQEWERSQREKRYKGRSAAEHVNKGTMYPWQDVEETVKASYPEIPKLLTP